LIALAELLPASKPPPPPLLPILPEPREVKSDEPVPGDTVEIETVTPAEIAASLAVSAKPDLRAEKAEHPPDVERPDEKKPEKLETPENEKKADDDEGPPTF
jgi:hypothetical protein